MSRQAKHVRRQLTPAEQQRVEATRLWAEQNKDQIKRQAKVFKQQSEAARVALQDTLKALKAERIRQGLSLADVHERSGIERPNLSRLENEAEANPTIATLMRYAEALGKRVLIVLDDIPGGKNAAQA